MASHVCESGELAQVSRLRPFEAGTGATPFGLRAKQDAEKRRHEEEKAQKQAQVAAAKALLAKKRSHNKGQKLTDEEKAARLAAQRLLRACDKKRPRPGPPGRGSAEVQIGLGVEAHVVQGRGELINSRNLQQTLHSPMPIRSSSSTESSR